MITQVCKCDDFGNTGLPQCISLLGKDLGMLITSRKASDGTLNKLQMGSLGFTGIDTLANLYTTELSQRLYPLMDLDNVTHPLEDNQYATTNGGKKFKTRDGIYSINFEKWEVSPVFVGKLNQSGSCGDYAFYRATTEGIVGIKKPNSNYLYPIAVNNLVFKYMDADDQNPSKLMGSFDFDASVNIGELWLIPWSAMRYTPEKINGIVDLNINPTVYPTVDGGDTILTVQINTDYGSGNPSVNTIEGMTVSDFTLVNKTTGLEVTISSVEEDFDNARYIITYASETLDDKMKLQVVPTASLRFEGMYKFTQIA